MSVSVPVPRLIAGGVLTAISSNVGSAEPIAGSEILIPLYEFPNVEDGASHAEHNNDSYC